MEGAIILAAVSILVVCVVWICVENALDKPRKKTFPKYPLEPSPRFISNREFNGLSYADDDSDDDSSDDTIEMTDLIRLAEIADENSLANVECTHDDLNQLFVWISARYDGVYVDRITTFAVGLIYEHAIRLNDEEVWEAAAEFANVAITPRQQLRIAIAMVGNNRWISEFEFQFFYSSITLSDLIGHIKAHPEFDVLDLLRLINSTVLIFSYVHAMVIRGFNIDVRATLYICGRTVEAFDAIFTERYRSKFT